MKDLFERTKSVAIYLISNHSTVRKTAKHFGLAKSTIHYDLTVRLPKYDYSLYEEVRQILNMNFNEKYIRGGLATKQKYSKNKQKKCH